MAMEMEIDECKNGDGNKRKIAKISRYSMDRSTNLILLK